LLFCLSMKTWNGWGWIGNSKLPVVLEYRVKTRQSHGSLNETGFEQ
jgi:hypothetical protein